MQMPQGYMMGPAGGQQYANANQVVRAPRNGHMGGGYYGAGYRERDRGSYGGGNGYQQRQQQQQGQGGGGRMPGGGGMAAGQQMRYQVCDTTFVSIKL